MMKSVASTLVIAFFALIMPLHVGAGGSPQYDAPHYDPGNGKTCETCHTSSIAPVGNNYNTVCLSCHNPSNPGATTAFTVADQANPYNSHSVVGINKVYQTSHRWDGSDTVPEAGAVPPQSLLMNGDGLRDRTSSSLACVRCHDPHRNDLGCAKCHDPNFTADVAAANGSGVIAANFLRVPNNADQMCLDCHRPRNVASHLQGSHPVLVNYSAIATANPAKFVKPVKNNNSANATSDLNAPLALSGKQVVCTTCHGVHYTDSRSSTVDGKTAFARLSTSDGNILRTDRRSAAVAAGAADKTNLCTNCHAAKVNHNNASQNVQCNDCHGAHVEYDAADPKAAKGVNIFLVRRNVTVGGQPAKVFYRYTASTKREFVNTDNAGIGMCQRCHTTPTTGFHTTALPTQCGGCHVHNSTKGSFSAECTACHGYPPAQISGGGAHTNANDCSRCHGDMSTHNAAPHSATCFTCHPTLKGSHTVHTGTMFNLVSQYGFGSYTTVNTSDSNGYRFGCINCHPYANSNHPNGTVAMNNVVGYSAGTKKCSSTYCHSDGKGNYALTPAWGTPYPNNSSKCALCHAALPTSGSHTAHVTTNGNHSGVSGVDYGSAANYSCNKCHAGTVNSSNAIVGFQFHVNKVGDVAFNNDTIISKAQLRPASFSTYTAVWSRIGGYKVDANSYDISKVTLNSGAYVANAGTCSTIICHNNGTSPGWNTSATPKISCIDCHSSL